MSIEFWNFQHSSITNYLLHQQVIVAMVWNDVMFKVTEVEERFSLKNTHYGLRKTLKTEVRILSQFFVIWLITSNLVSGNVLFWKDVKIILYHFLKPLNVSV